MAYEVVNSSPKIGDFVLLSDHQAQTPGTFFGSTPVLHLHCPNASVAIHGDELSRHADFAQLNNAITTQSQDTESSPLVWISDIDIWISSRHLTLFNQKKSYGLRIFYTAICFHAKESAERVLLELNLSDANTADEDLEYLRVTLAPVSYESPEPQGSGSTVTPLPNGHGRGKSADELFEAISACQELNPDPRLEDPEGAFDESAPGATGWITGENMQNFIDEDGSFRMPTGATVIGVEDETAADEPVDDGAESLGEGAGRARPASEAMGVEGEEDEVKWQRTE